MRCDDGRTIELLGEQCERSVRSREYSCLATASECGDCAMRVPLRTRCSTWVSAPMSYPEAVALGVVEVKRGAALRQACSQITVG
jgi:hypothetical protein